MKIFTLFLFFCSCNSARQPSGHGEGDTVSVRVNNTFTIKLSTSMGTGYSWGLPDSAWSGNMSLDSVTIVNNTEGKDDGPDTQVFYFKALKKSTTILHFIRKRPWESADKANKRRDITVIIE